MNLRPLPYPIVAIISATWVLLLNAPVWGSEQPTPERFTVDPIVLQQIGEICAYVHGLDAAPAKDRASSKAYLALVVDELAWKLEREARDPLSGFSSEPLDAKTLAKFRDAITSAVKAYRVPDGPAANRFSFLRTVVPQIDAAIEGVARRGANQAQAPARLLADTSKTNGSQVTQSGDSLVATEQVSALYWLLVDLENTVAGRMPLGLIASSPIAGASDRQVAAHCRIEVRVHRVPEAYGTRILDERSVFDAYVQSGTPGGVVAIEVMSLTSGLDSTAFTRQPGLRAAVADDRMQFFSHFNRQRYTGRIGDVPDRYAWNGAQWHPSPEWCAVLIDDLRKLRARVQIDVAANAHATPPAEVDLRSLPLGSIRSVSTTANDDQWMISYRGAMDIPLGTTTVRIDQKLGTASVTTVLPESAARLSDDQSSPVLSHRNGRQILDQMARTAEFGWQVVHRRVRDGQGRLLYEFVINPLERVRSTPSLLLTDEQTDREIAARLEVARQSESFTTRFDQRENAPAGEEIVEFLRTVGAAPFSSAKQSMATYGLHFASLYARFGDFETAAELQRSSLEALARLLTPDQMFYFAAGEMSWGHYATTRAICDRLLSSPNRVSRVSHVELSLLRARSHWWAVKTGQSPATDDALKYYREFKEQFPHEVGSVLAELRLSAAMD